ncbi:MAG TPA: antitoxin [Mycobacterium sp.]|nr:antitoxin [Mycobacterium sp.]
MSFLDKAKDAVEKNIDKVGEAIDKAGDLVDEKTGGKFADTVDKVQDAAKGAADKIAGDDK